MRNFTEITRVTSNNCGGKGAWIDNPLNSPRPGNDEWLGFQYGGGGGGRKRKTRKTRQVRKRRMSHKTRRKNKKRHHKFR
jgi:hypothetical protein